MNSPYSFKARVVMHVFCEDCGEEVRVCQCCEMRGADSLSGLCGECYTETSYYGAFYKPDTSEMKPCFVCPPCQYERQQISAQVWSYWYWPADSSKPLSPTNVYRVPRFRAVSEGPTDPVERADEALAAYNEELKFSGNQEEAFKIYNSFYNRKHKRLIKKDPKAIKEGFVSLNEILQGQHVTGDQFFAAIRASKA